MGQAEETATSDDHEEGVQVKSAMFLTVCSLSIFIVPRRPLHNLGSKVRTFKKGRTKDCANGNRVIKKQSPSLVF